MPSQIGRRSNAELVERVKSVLASRNLTLYQASGTSATLFGGSSPHFLPHNLYYDLRQGSFSPSLFQLFAFSRITNYRLTDWLRVFGFDLEAISRIQACLPSRRTVLLDSALIDPQAFIPWLRNSRMGASPAGVVPFSRVLEWTSPRRVASLAELTDKGFLYAKIGYADVLAFPDLLSGSIVRVRPRGKDRLRRQVTGEESGDLFLIEHEKGLSCCRIRDVGGGRIAAISNQLSYAQVEFRVPEEARLLGVVDFEVRSLLKPTQPVIAKDLAMRWKPDLLSPEPSQLGPLLRRARLRMGLSFRAASVISREVAASLDDERYFIAPGSLSDYETLNIPPRHFHKILTCCAAYSLRLSAILDALSIRLQDAGREPMPDVLTGRRLSATGSAGTQAGQVERTGFIRELAGVLEEVPLFLRPALRVLCGLARPSLNDFFWIGGTRCDHPCLAGGLLAVVNRQKKKPNDCGSKPLWQQPLYVVLKRDGTYLCGCCSRENSSLVVHTYPNGVHKREQFKDRDAEVIGKIVLVVRRL